MNGVGAGVGIIVENSNNEILLLKRKSSHGSGQFSIPGGSVDLGESLLEAAKRELEEETDLIANELYFLGVTNNIATYEKEGVHTLSIIFHVNSFTGNPKIMEPNKHELLDWYHEDLMPTPQFEASKLALSLLNSTIPFLVEGVKE